MQYCDMGSLEQAIKAGLFRDEAGQPKLVSGTAPQYCLHCMRLLWRLSRDGDGQPKLSGHARLAVRACFGPAESTRCA